MRAFIFIDFDVMNYKSYHLKLVKEEGGPEIRYKELFGCNRLKE